ncbi:glycosyl transferase [Methylobacterium radiodurans]|uniref:Glycosyl transferase n=1 Tax=Methylobacterium radiodurans TaxID=2202828 RepID=A0A2U8VZW3_9HYPH|nr:glycosyl transferase [Methylobacterium radiodurans]
MSDAGRAVPFRLETTDDALFGRRLVLPGGLAGWIVLSYRTDPAAVPQRPLLRALASDGSAQDFVLPGGARAHWLGLIPPATAEIRLAAPPGFHLDRVGRRGDASLLLQALGRRPFRAVAALYERARGDARRYRDTLRGACAVTPLAGYAAWARARAEIAPTSEVSASGAPAAIRVLIAARAGQEAALARTLASLAAQTSAAWTAQVLTVGAAVMPARADPRIAAAPWRADRPLPDLLGVDAALCLLEPGDVLAPDALASLGAHLGPASLVYADEVGADGLPRLKPDWSPDFALAAGYLGRPWLAARERLGRALDAPLGNPADLALRLDIAVAGGVGAVRHLQRVLARTEARLPEGTPRRTALVRHLAEAGSSATVAARDGVPDLLWPLPEPAPLASIVIPSRDRLDLIAQVCRGVLHETAYPAIELIIVDNGSTDPAVLAHYDTLRADPRVTILSDPEPFNFSRLVNRGVAAASGPVVVLLNNDIAVLEPGWLDALVRQACRPDVGAVGAKLVYGDGRLQHAGVVVGLGGRAGHILRRRPGDTPGHLGQMRVAHEVSAVTAACLAVRRDLYAQVGGFDAETFPVDFNDVDFCLRLRREGLRVLWTPAARLAHLESVSRGPSVGAARTRFEAEAARFAERWHAVIRHDPYYHPCLSLTTFGEDLE